MGGDVPGFELEDGGAEVEYEDASCGFELGDNIDIIPGLGQIDGLVKAFLLATIGLASIILAMLLECCITLSDNCTNIVLDITNTCNFNAMVAVSSLLAPVN